MRLYIKLILLIAFAGGAHWMISQREDEMDEAVFVLRVYAHQVAGNEDWEALVQAAGRMSERSFERYWRRLQGEKVAQT